MYVDAKNPDEEIKELNLKENIERIKHKIIVMSGKGGVGKSTFAVNIAMSLALSGKITGILDIDLHGPSIVKMLGIKAVGMPVDERGVISPVRAYENLYVVSIASMLEDPDAPIIWRGPLKMGAIKQFLRDITWPELDYLIIDSPPGTGDEPLSIIQILGELDGSLIVTTPQEVAHIDVRKSIRFSQTLNVRVLGVVENMSGFICPHCGKEVAIFKKGTTKKMAKDMGVDFLGEIPIEKDIVEATDNGRPYIYDYGKMETAKRIEEIVKNIIKKVEEENKGTN